ncbi:hypothetical protein M231_03770 [Tremella mesenterica]|uniref:Ricin B lectin domain-containing protein n=1 Tax=Tremella mesenterica TaxID=5217 RepID=A0A4Q1BM84_TREME|nr:hypothetical protein M231_03770 [Tremella mesenterica]
MLSLLLGILTLTSLSLASPLSNPEIVKKDLNKRYTNVNIVSGVDGKLLAAAPKTGDGSIVTSVSPGTFWATVWDINPGAGQVTLVGGSLVLDAGEALNGGQLVVKSPDGSSGQNWYLTDDNRIAITGGTACLDEGENGAQTWDCTTGNDNQGEF